MKIDRLIGIITVLLQKDKITAPQLAERFEVSRRTINRDIEDLCKAGIPLVTTQGYGGGISIAEGYKLDKTLFTQEEIQTILAGLKGIDSVSKTSYLTKLAEKLSGREHRIASDDMILIDLASHYQGPLTQKIDTMKQAIRGHHLISFRYFYEKGEQQRTIEPYHLVFQWSSWYVFGYCLKRQAYRLFKLNRLWDLELEPEQFAVREVPKEELDFKDFYKADPIRLKAVFENEEKHRLIEEYGIDCYTVDENNRLLFEWDFVSYDNMREWICSFGDRVRVLEPEELYEDRKRQAGHILEMERGRIWRNRFGERAAR